MNWIKITEDKKSLPEFKHPVLLIKKSGELGKPSQVCIRTGYLLSIDADGYHFYTGNFMNDIFAAAFFPTKNDFNPTHWCEITYPQD